MSINYHGAAMLLSAHRRGISFGRVLTLGRLHLSFTKEDAARLRATFDFPAEDFATGAADDRYCEDFLERLGAESVTSLDVSDYQGSSICHDLNQPISDDWKEGYDLVIDGGTIEHVFHATMAIRNAMELIAEGGHYLGASPADHWLGHGFYQFSPEWYFRIFTPENGFEVQHVLLAEHSSSGSVFEVQDPAQAGTRLGIRSPHPVETIVLAKRTKIAPVFQNTPQQSDYSARWSEDKTEHSEPAAPSPLRKLAKMLMPSALLTALQQRAIAKRHAAEYARGLRQLRSYGDLE